MTPFRPTTIAIDFDRTFTSDVEFWRFFIRHAVKRGHTVICVTGRTETQYSKLQMATIFGEQTFPCVGVDRLATMRGLLERIGGGA